MPHHGQYEHVKEWLYDHDTDEVNETPPDQDFWYLVFDAEDVRLLWCRLFQVNDEAAAKNIELRWTIDGNVYLRNIALDSNIDYYGFRNYYPSTGGTAGLQITVDMVNAAQYVDKRGHSFKVEIQMTGVPGTNQNLQCQCVRETLEVT